MAKIRFHPAFYIYAAALILQGKFLTLAYTVASSVLHELGHAYAARLKGYMLNNVLILPFGAVLYGGEKLNKKDALAISLAGPLVSAFLITITLSLWWLFPSTHYYTEEFFNVNLSILVFNLLPAYPLDGARAILAVAKNTQKALKKLRVSGVILSIIMLCGFIASAFYKINYSLGLMSVMTFISATSGTEKERYVHLAAGAPFSKMYDRPIKKECYAVSENVKVIELLKLIKPDKIIEIRIFDALGKETAFLNEKSVEKLCLCGLSESIKTALIKSGVKR